MTLRPSYVHVAAAAVFLTLSSGALAARHFLLSSSKQVSPKVLAKLRAQGGTPGPAGPRGLDGDTGAPGDRGARGPMSAVPATLAPGQTETGVWSASTVAHGAPHVGYLITASFPIPLPAALAEGSVGYVSAGLKDSTACPGPGQAAPGFLCLYEQFSENLDPPSLAAIFDPERAAGPAQTVGSSGFALLETSHAEGPSAAEGTYAVTAPRTGGLIEVAVHRRDGNPL